MPVLRRPKYDVVIVAVRYAKNGNVDWVRAFERRGATWSDYRMISRAEIIERIQAGERVVTGERIQYLAGSFNINDPVGLVESGATPLLLAGEANGNQDHLAGVPIL